MILIIFAGGVYIGENTSRSESVERSEARVCALFNKAFMLC